VDLRRIDLTPRSLDRPLWWWIPHRARRALITVAFLMPIIAIAIVLLPGPEAAPARTLHDQRVSNTFLTPLEEAISYQVRHPAVAPTTTTSTTTTTAPPVVQSAPAVTTPPPTAPAAPAPQPDVDTSSAAAWAASAGVACIRDKESGDDYSADTGNGYYGAYQDLLSTWESEGGSGLPSDAPPAVQDQINYQIYLSGGWGQWSTASVCGL
jgi:hypothetical protein